MTGMDLLVLVPPALATAFFLVAGIVTWSYRDVYRRHGRGAESHDAHAGH
jgi:hypothetical protein